jgi:hypothetical protein
MAGLATKAIGAALVAMPLVAILSVMIYAFGFILAITMIVGSTLIALAIAKGIEMLTR